MEGDAGGKLRIDLYIPNLPCIHTKYVAIVLDRIGPGPGPGPYYAQLYRGVHTYLGYRLYDVPARHPLAAMA